MFTDALKTKLDYITCRWFVLIKSTLNVDLITTNSQRINSSLVLTFPNTYHLKGGSDSPNTEVYLSASPNLMSGTGSIMVTYSENNETYSSSLGVNRDKVEYIV